MFWQLHVTQEAFLLNPPIYMSHHRCFLVEVGTEGISAKHKHGLYVCLAPGGNTKVSLVEPCSMLLLSVPNLALLQVNPPLSLGWFFLFWRKNGS